jgi:hypothetical protein
MANADDPIDNTINRIKSEYREMPGLHLTFEQMLRLWRLDRSTCRILIETLIDAHFLKTTRDGRYVRCDAGDRRDRCYSFHSTGARGSGR